MFNVPNAWDTKLSNGRSLGITLTLTLTTHCGTAMRWPQPPDDTLWRHIVWRHIVWRHTTTMHCDDILPEQIQYQTRVSFGGDLELGGKDYKVCNKVWQFRCCSFALADWLKQSAEYSRIQKCLSMTSGMPHDDPWHRSVLLLDFEQHRCKTCFDWMPALIDHTGPFLVSGCLKMSWDRMKTSISLRHSFRFRTLVGLKSFISSQKRGGPCPIAGLRDTCLACKKLLRMVIPSWFISHGDFLCVKNWHFL